MNVIPPVEITNSRLTDSNIPIDDYPVWSEATTYEVGDRVVVIDGDGVFYNSVYESVSTANIGNDPWLDNVEAPEDWLLVEKVNRWKMFELMRNTQTIGDGSIEVEITPMVRVNTVALFNLQAEQVQCVMRVDGEIVYDQTSALSVRETATWSEYFFGEFTFQKAVFFKDLPPFTQGVITVTISRVSGEVKCGGLVVGTSINLGSTEARAESDALNFSTVERDEFGNARLVSRRTIPKTVQRVFTDKSRVDRLMQVRDDLNAVPAVWTSLDDPLDGYFGAMFILGFYRVFRISLDHPEHAILNLELEEI